MFGGIVFLPLFLQVVTGATATNSGLLILPLMVGLIGASVTSGRLITRSGRYRRYPIAGMALTTLALLLLSTMDAATMSCRRCSCCSSVSIAW
jgi:MFS family permease